MVVGAGFEPANSERTDLQSACFSHLHIPPKRCEGVDCRTPIHDAKNFLEISSVHSTQRLLAVQQMRETYDTALTFPRIQA